MARVHAMGAASDAAVAVALAGSIFFSISPEDSRARVVLYLLITMAPFAVVAPLIGPAIDRLRGGRRMMIIATAFGRAVLASSLITHIETLWLFPLAFGLLVLQKGYLVAKSAVVPELVRSDQDLVLANSRLALISAVAGTAGLVVAAAVALVGGPSVAAGLASAGFFATSLLALKIAPVVVAAEPPAADEKAELRDAPVVWAATATAVLRGLVGFVTFLLAFEFRGGKDGLDVSTLGSALGGATATARGIDITGDPAAPAWHFAVVLIAAAAGALLGAHLAPLVRERISEELMLQTVLAAVCGAGLFAVFANNLFGTTLMAFAVVCAASTGKLAFDSLVQRVAPDANHGRSFARFEARFQIVWVLGALVSAQLPLNIVVGHLVVVAASSCGLVSYSLRRGGRDGFTDRVRRIVRFCGRGRRGAGGRSRSGGGTRRSGRAGRAREQGAGSRLTLEDLRPSQPKPPAGAAEAIEAAEAVEAGTAGVPQRSVFGDVAGAAGDPCAGDDASEGVLGAEQAASDHKTRSTEEIGDHDLGSRRVD